MGGKEQKEKSRLPRTFHLGSLAVFSQGRGAPLDSLQEGLFSRKKPCLLAPFCQKGCKSQEQSLAATPATPAGGSVDIPNTGKPHRPLWGPGGYWGPLCKDHPETRPGSEKVRANKTGTVAVNCLAAPSLLRV